MSKSQNQVTFVCGGGERPDPTLKTERTLMDVLSCAEKLQEVNSF